MSELDWELIARNFNRRIDDLLKKDGKNMSVIQAYITDCETQAQAPEKIKNLMMELSNTIDMLIVLAGKTKERIIVLRNIAMVEKEIFGATLLKYAVDAYENVSKEKVEFRIMDSYNEYIDEILEYVHKISKLCKK